jgi:hypothetical protein
MMKRVIAGTGAGRHRRARRALADDPPYLDGGSAPLLDWPRSRLRTPEEGRNVMKYVLRILPVLLLALVSCTTTENSIYQSVAPEARGERAISSAIELIAEVDIETAYLGVFYSKEVFHDGEAQNVLFTVRAKSFYGERTGRITDYSFQEPASLSVDQAKRFLDAIEEYLGKDPASVKPTEMISYELYSGTLDLSAGSERYRPFQNLTFMAICSVTNTGKRFRTALPYSMSTPSDQSYTSYARYDLTNAQVEKLRDAIVAALAKSSPIIPALPAAKPGS